MRFGLIIILFSQQELFAQTFVCAGQFSGPNYKQLIGTVIDPEGNVYSVGTLTGSLDVDPGAGILNYTTPVVNKDYDMFVIKQSSTGNLIWARHIIGDTSVIATSIAIIKNGFIDIVGSFKSTVDFDPGPGIVNLTADIDTSDIFILRLDTAGDFVNVNRISAGSSKIDAHQIISDHQGNMLASVSFKGTVDIDPGPAVLQFSSAETDYIICKFSADGALLWAKQFSGGNYGMFMYDMTVDMNGNIFFCGYFSGTIDFDPGVGVVNLICEGIYNGYIAKLTPLGEFTWARLLSCTHRCSVNQFDTDPAGNIYCAGFFTESADFDPGPGSYTLVSSGGNNAFAFKLNNNGDFVWAEKFGSTLNSNCNDIVLNNDGGIILATSFTETMSINTGTNILNLTSNGGSDIALINLNVNGEFESLRQIGNSEPDGPNYICTDTNDNLYLSGVFGGSVDFDPGPGFNILTSIGIFPYSDLFLMKLSASNFIKGSSYFDSNTDGIKQTTEPPLTGVIVKATRNNLDYYAISDSAGNYKIEVDTNTYTVTPALPLYYTSSLPSAHIVNFGTQLGQVAMANDFGLFPATSVRDMKVSLTNLGPARPGLETQYRITYENIGTDSMSGTVTMTPDPLISFVSASPVPATVNPFITWSFTNLPPSGTGNIDVLLNVSSTAAIGHSLKSKVNLATSNDFNLFNNADSVIHTVTYSFDPNGKTVIPDGPIPLMFVNAGNDLGYTIRFQNTGTDTAFTVIIRDTISNNADISSFKMISASAPYSITIEDNNILVWRFDNIVLPDSNVNEHASHGFVRFTIKPKSSLIVGDEIRNKAAIYFDFNTAVLTNETENIVIENPVPLSLLDFSGKNINGQIRLTWETADEINTSHFIIERAVNNTQFLPVGKVVSKGNSSRRNDYEFTDLYPANGFNYYRLKMVDADGKFQYSNILDFEIIEKNKWYVRPNPAAEHVLITHPVDQHGEIKIIDQNGRVVKKQLISAGIHETKVMINNLSPGIYNVSWTNGLRTLNKRVVKQ